MGHSSRNLFMTSSKLGILSKPGTISGGASHSQHCIQAKCELYHRLIFENVFS